MNGAPYNFFLVNKKKVARKCGAVSLILIKLHVTIIYITKLTLG